MDGQERKGVPRLIRGLIVIAVGLIIWFSPIPAGVKKEAWHLLAIFVATIVGLILTPLPQGAMVIIGVMVTGFTQTLNVGTVLSGFANRTVWLIVSAFLLTRAFIKTGLGRRIAYLFIRTFGRKTLGLSYAIAATDLVLSPATPSNTARSGGIIYPIVGGMASTFGSEPGESARKIGSFLMMAEYQVVVITTSMFMTAGAANPLLVELAKKTANISVSWETWVVAAMDWLPSLIILLLFYFYSHYGFASCSARVSAMFVPLLTVALAAKVPPYLAVLTMGLFSGIDAGTTHYGTGPSPIYYNSGYVPLGTWWRLGLIISFVNITIWLGVGFPRMKLSGLW